jgi:hypothetical protein
LNHNVGSSASGYNADDLGIGGKPAKRLLGAGYTVVNADLKDAPTGPPQCHLRIWSDLADEVRRLTGARFIVSLTAVLDFDVHRLSSLIGEAVVVPQGTTSVSPVTACRWSATSLPRHRQLIGVSGAAVSSKADMQCAVSEGIR